MANYIEPGAARGMSGLRLVLVEGLPSPWGEAAKGIFHVKGLPFVRVRQVAAGPNTELVEWTGQNSAPVAAWNNERPRTTWTEQLFLAERLAPQPALIPANPEKRALMFGLSHEICGEMGFGWCRRLMILHTLLTDPNVDEQARALGRRLGAKYGYTPAAAEAAPARVAEIVALLAAQLDRQQKQGSRFFIGERLSALDIYWATFAAMIRPLPHELCPMTDTFRTLYTSTSPQVQAAVTPDLLADRDFIYSEYLETPVDL